MTSDEQKKYQDVLAEFIRIYRSEPCLWRIKSAEYYDKAKKEAAYNKLVEKYKEIYPRGDRTSVVRKINCLRTNYRKQRRRFLESQRFGSGKETYKPSLWYYPLLDFLRDQYHPSCPSSSSDEVYETTNPAIDCDLSLDDDSYNNDHEDTTKCQEETDLKHEESDNEKSVEEIETHFVYTNESQRHDMLINNSDDISEVPWHKKIKLQAEKEKIGVTSQSALQQTNDEFQMFANHVAEQLRLLPLDKALCLQVEIQKMIADQRIEHFKANIGKN